MAGWGETRTDDESAWASSKRFGGVEALAFRDLEVEVGDVLGYLGPNGAGKTTTIRLLLDHWLARSCWPAPSPGCRG